jgi:hypothetical protein
MSNKVVVKFSIYYARDLKTPNIGWMLKDLFPGVALADLDGVTGICQFNLVEAMNEVLTSSQASGEFFYRAGMNGPVFKWDPVSKNVVQVSLEEMNEAGVFVRVCISCQTLKKFSPGKKDELKNTAPCFFCGMQTISMQPRDALTLERKTWVKGVLSGPTEEARRQAVTEGWTVESEDEYCINYVRKIAT